YIVPRENAADEAGSVIRARLGERLPEHMLPAAFVFLKALPLTPNGKVDRRALPEPGDERYTAGDAYVAPRPGAEQILARIWTEVLGVERVGTEDNFFALGGDSILSLQVTSRAQRQGLRITPRDLFEHPTVARLAMVAKVAKEAADEQEAVTGPVALTPIQQWFFDQDFVAPHHFNLPLLLELRRPVSLSILDKALLRLWSHHDALRLRFVRSEEGWQQKASPPEGATLLIAIDLSGLAAAAQATAIEAGGAMLQASLDLARGPLLRAALFELGAERPQRLLLIGHHLVLDTVSWQILAEDLVDGLEQAGAGEEIGPPLKTASFQRWARRLAEHALSPAVTAEMEWWTAEPRSRVVSLPVDFPMGDNTRREARTCWSSLDAEETRALLQEVPRLSRTKIQEVLVAALSLA